MNSEGQEPPRVWVVDDDRTTRVLLRQVLEREGYQVMEAADGETCLQMAEQDPPDVILLDALMPGMDGFTCCTELQKRLSSERTAILMITGLNDAASVDHAFAAGAIDYVTKPIHWPVLRHRVRRLIQQARLYRQLEEANKKLEQLAIKDGLTQLANRRYFDQFLDQQWRQLARAHAPLSLILCDVDHFKIYNDTYGHPMGDACLRQVAMALNRAIRRTTDLVARYGGEEFAIVLPHTDTEGALTLIEAVQREVKQLAIHHVGSATSQQVTLSLGLATVIPHPCLTSEILITRADKALYQAKLAGRDRYSVNQESDLPNVTPDCTAELI